MKKWFSNNLLYIIGAVVGAVSGYLYWQQIGCSSGTCAITSRPLNGTLFSAVMGALLLGLFFKKKIMTMTLEEMIQSNKPVLVDFFAEWCGPCKMMAPVLKEVKATIGDTATIIKVDIDKSPQAANEYQVQGVPTFILFKNGKPLWRNSGVIPKAKLIEVIKNFTDKN